MNFCPGWFDGCRAVLRRFAAWPLWIALVFCAASAGAQDLVPVPPLVARVVDNTGTLSPEQKAGLDAKLAALEQRKGSQLVVLLVPSTQPEDIASFANRVANEWKVGRRKIGDGVLLIVAKGDRQVRIEVAKTLEGAIPDLAAKRVIEQAITPAFKRGDYAGGLEAGVDRLVALISGEALPEPAKPSGTARLGEAGFEWTDLLIFMLFALPVGAAVARSALGRKRGAVATGAGVGAMAWFFSASILIAGLAALVALVYAVVTGFAGSALARAGGPRRSGRSGGWGPGGFGAGAGMGSIGGWGGGGGSGGSSGGGGFSSGGGGDFGGGGASGSW